MKSLIRTDTQETVTIAGPELADGRVLVQNVSNGTVEVINGSLLKVVDQTGGDR
jgi:hypothetical protein